MAMTEAMTKQINTTGSSPSWMMQVEQTLLRIQVELAMAVAAGYITQKEADERFRKVAEVFAI